MIIDHRLPGTACLAGFCLLLLPISAHANGLVGTSVTGDLTFSGGTANYYDPANGFVPSGYLNTAGTTVTIASPATEFGFADTGNTDLANFSASQFTVEDVVASNGGDAAWNMTFTDPAFTGQSFVKVSDSFPHGGLTYSLAGDVITISWAGGTVVANDDYTSTFVVSTPVPEPATWVAVGLGAGILFLVARRKRNALA